MKLDPDHLQMLSVVVDSGGLSEGARQLGKSQPSLSRTVAMLEARLGTRLFEKGRKPLRPTELCRTLADQGRLIAKAARTAEAAVDLYNGGKSGTARVAGTPIFMDGVISNMIASFQTRFPDVTIHQSYGYLGDLAEQLKLDNIDLAICPVGPDTLPAGAGFKPILKGRNVIACAPSHPLARKPALTLSDIAPYPWIAPPVNSPLYDDLKVTLSAIGISDFQVSFTGGSLASILSVLSGSKSLTVLPFSVVFMLRHTKSITSLPIRIEHPKRQLGLMWLEGQTPRPAVARFRKYIEAEFGELSQHVNQMMQRTVWKS